VIVGKRPKIVLLGIMSRMPFGGPVWNTLQYLIGFERLGYEPYYVEAHGSTPKTFMHKPEDDGWAKAAEWVNDVMRRVGMQDRWAYLTMHDGRCFGMSKEALRELYASAAYVINLHGSTRPNPELKPGGEVVFVDTDPVEVQVEIHEGRASTIEYLEAHHSFVTWGLNYGRPDCKVPTSDRFPFRPNPPAIVMDIWDHTPGEAEAFTTIGNWRQEQREFTFNGETYHWSKHREFIKFIDLPARTGATFELALSSYTGPDRAMLELHGWKVRDAIPFSMDLDAYREFIQGSRGEFTVAKDQNVRFRSGWFSERSASYLACGRPVITQETGFSNVLPTGLGLFGFTTLEEIVDAVAQIRSDYARHSRAAREIAAEYFDYRIVLPQLLSHAVAA
jgi:hypothetical protein